MKSNSLGPRYFVRATLDPYADIQRGFSGVYNAWVRQKEDIPAAVADVYPDGADFLLPPRQDPVSGEWCWDPEAGLSSFSFSDEAGFAKAMVNIDSYARHLGCVAVFRSSDYDLQAGADGEDLFREGDFLGWFELGLGIEDFGKKFPETNLTTHKIGEAPGIE